MKTPTVCLITIILCIGTTTVLGAGYGSAASGGMKHGLGAYGSAASGGMIHGMHGYGSGYSAYSSYGLLTPSMSRVPYSSPPVPFQSSLAIMEEEMVVMMDDVSSGFCVFVFIFLLILLLNNNSG